MDQHEIHDWMSEARPGPDDVVYLERRAAEYARRVLAGGTARAGAMPAETGQPAMLGGDRCGWPLDEPFPVSH